MTLLLEVTSGFTYKMVRGPELYEKLWHLPENEELHKRIKYLSSGYSDYKEEIDWLCLEGRKIVGVAGFKNNPYDKNDMWITFISVDPDYREKGIGQELARKVIQFAAKHKLSVTPSSYTAMGQKSLKKIIDTEAEKLGVTVNKEG